MCKKSYQVSLVVIGCVFINYMAKYFTSLVSVPLWMDSIGTAIAAYILGPFCGAVVGATVNVIYGFQDPMSFLYAITNAAVGVAIGICVKRKMMDNYFGVLSIASIAAILSVFISVPINCIAYQGYTGNIFGDEMFIMLKEWDINWVLAAVIVELFLDFLDKLVCLLILYLLILFCRKIIKKKIKGDKAISSILLVLIISASLASIPSDLVKADDYNEVIDYSSYIQTVYSNDNGLLSGEANDIVATEDGVLWIGTYAGLYRYTGTDFQYMNNYETVKNVNCLFLDVEGRLWIGTNDDGLSICIEGEIVNNLNEDNGLPSNSVRSIAQRKDGTYVVGTSDSLTFVELSSGVRIKKVFPDIVYATSIATDDKGNVVVVNSAGEMYLIQGDNVTQKLDKNTAGNGFSCCEFDANGQLFAGNTGGTIEVYDISSGKFKSTKSLQCGELSEINDIKLIDTGDMFICAENGIAYIDTAGKYKILNTGEFNNSVDHMSVDYQHNLWFCSSRLGVLKMCSSYFTEVYNTLPIDKKVVNAVTEWNGLLYVGTDSGLDIINEKNSKIVYDELYKLMADTRIRCLMVDSNNELWISSYGKGFVNVKPDGEIVSYTTVDGMLGSKFRSSIELSDGSIAVSSEEGITFIKDGAVHNTIGVKEGLKNTLVLTMLQASDNTIYAGTDGGGISVIKDGKVVDTLNRASGLGSGVILRLVKDSDNDNLFIVTSNGICYMDEDGSIRKLSNFPYSNNYDLYDDGKGTLFVTGSAGIYVVNKEQLLSGDDVDYELLNYLTGMRETFTANAKNYISDDEYWYIACNNGVSRMNMYGYQMKAQGYRMLLDEIQVDGMPYTLNDSSVVELPKGENTIEINPEIINYSLTDPYVAYMLEGVDEDWNIVKQSELSTIYYFGLKDGTSKFRLAIMDKGRNKIISEQTIIFEKEKELHNSIWFKVYFFSELALIIAWITWFITKSIIQRTIDIQRRELALARDQINMGNETILAIAKTVDAKDTNTSLHSTRVSEYSVLIAKKLGYSESEQENLRKAALLHDIGKIGIPDRVLNKPSKLDDDEYAVMKQHVIKGGEILKDFSLIPHVQEGAMYHHEKYDGTGYANGLKGDDIPEYARIIGIADAFDAMTANRVYRKKLDFDYVLSEIKKGSGTQFDPKMVEIMLQLIEEGSIDKDELYGKGSDE